MKNLLIIFAICSTLLFQSCKKDQLKVNEEKTFSEVNHVPSGPFDGGWQLTLKPKNIADILPSGDIMYRGTYNINGDKIKVKTHAGNFEFKINSQTELKEVKHGIILRLDVK